MSDTMVQTAGERPASAGLAETLRVLIGSGDRIGRLVLPFLAVGVGLNIWRPALFGVGGPGTVLKAVSVAMLVPGVTIYLWSVFLILTRVPKGELITTGPYALVKHPLYTAVGLLVLPAAGFLRDSWLGALLGIVLYIGSRMFAPDEEKALSRTFGAAWDEYRDRVKIPWL